MVKESQNFLIILVAFFLGCKENSLVIKHTDCELFKFTESQLPLSDYYCKGTANEQAFSYSTKDVFYDNNLYLDPSASKAPYIGYSFVIGRWGGSNGLSSPFYFQINTPIQPNQTLDAYMKKTFVQGALYPVQGSINGKDSSNETGFSVFGFVQFQDWTNTRNSTFLFSENGPQDPQKNIVEITDVLSKGDTAIITLHFNAKLYSLGHIDPTIGCFETVDAVLRTPYVFHP
jgi:hypothetical protein